MAAKKSRRKKSRNGQRSSGTRKRRQASAADRRRIRELSGLALFAVGCFAAAVIYLGWSGGLVGQAMVDGLRYLFGILAYLVPPVLLAAGAFMVFPDIPRGPRAFQVGLLLLTLAAFLIAGANTFSLVGGDQIHTRFFDGGYIAAHGGIVGDALYWPTSRLLGDVGSTIAALFMLLAAAFLITGASVKTVLVTSGKGAKRAAAGAHRTTRQLGQTMAERRLQRPGGRRCC
jgi:S-DNA-T family DNA segregation ATPase FtsK/SpoIIIE